MPRRRFPTSAFSSLTLPFTLTVALVAVAMFAAPGSTQSPTDETRRTGIAIMGRLPDTPLNRGLRQYLGQRRDIQLTVEVQSRDEFFRRLAMFSRAGRTYDFLIILGHGAGDLPHITLNTAPEEALDPKLNDFDAAHHQANVRDVLRIREEIKTRLFTTLYKEEKTEEDQQQLDIYRNQLEMSETRLTDPDIGVEVSQQALDYYDAIRDLLADDASVLLLNCSAAATTPHRAFVDNIGAVLLGRRGGRINASRTDLQVYTAYSDREDGLVGLHGLFNWTLTAFAYGRPVPAGDIAIRGWWRDFLGNWYTKAVAADPAASLYNDRLFVDFAPQSQQVPHGEVATLTSLVRPRPDSGALTYFWESARQGTPESTFSVDTREYEPGKLVRIRVTVQDERGRTGDSWGYVSIRKPDYAPAIELAPPVPRAGEVAHATVKMAKDAAPAEAMWNWTADGGVKITRRRGGDADILVTGRGTLRAQLYRLTRFGRQEDLAQAQVTVTPIGSAAGTPAPVAPADAPAPPPAEKTPAGAPAPAGAWVLQRHSDEKTLWPPPTTDTTNSVTFEGNAIRTRSFVDSDMMTFEAGSSATTWSELPRTVAWNQVVPITLQVASGERAVKNPNTWTSIDVQGATDPAPRLEANSPTIVWDGLARALFSSGATPGATKTVRVHHRGPGGTATRTYFYAWQAGLPAADTQEPGKLSATLSVVQGSAKVVLGQSLSFRASVASTPSTSPAGPVVYRWQPNSDARFSPAEGPSAQATALFTRVGRVMVWVDVLRRSGAVLSTAAESNQIEIDVTPPALSLRATPEQPYPGQEVRITASEAPAVDGSLITYWWEHAGNTISPGGGADPRVFSFRPKDTTPVKVIAHAKAIDGGDDLGAREIVVTARPHDVRVSEPATRGQKPRVWDPKRGELVDVDEGLALFQDFGLRAEVTPAPANPPLQYEWTVLPDGCSVSSPIAQEPTFNCSQAGTFAARVIVRDSLGATLGAGRRSFSISKPPMTGAGAGETAPPACRLDGNWEYREADGQIALALRQSGDRLTGTLAVFSDEETVRGDIQGSLTAGSIRLTTTLQGEPMTFEGPVSGDCGTLRLSVTVARKTHAMTFVRKQ